MPTQSAGVAQRPPLTPPGLQVVLRLVSEPTTRGRAVSWPCGCWGVAHGETGAGTAHHTVHMLVRHPCERIDVPGHEHTSTGVIVHLPADATRVASLAAVQQLTHGYTLIWLRLLAADTAPAVSA